ncbi:siderophore-interacting protein [Isoptericola sp. NEAU-Y5]|uniref:Siderophore-interacting protein n=1 Tax=Isoptericola luteus TaxID=2879484 RepID=A0ABS7ZJQ8_9MICO|nr:siderophore-interacting protein [Isoptericola sp. NEAU-Y5]MCA5891758.1 siderophore-interacting protein [Isoptericola sp. NEAU-Y5]MCA5894591.1 siderophore-interacting protein [Isoptericola sp. NEAU-Y5]
MFTRSRTRFDLVPRRVRVHAVTELTGSMRRTTFRDVDGADPGAPTSLAALRAPGPEDHVKVFLPDPATGELHAPTTAPDGGLQRPTGVVSISRDYTVRATRTVDGVAELDVDWVLHGDEGPASAWAARAAVGDEVVLAGPRGSVGVPDGVARLTLVGDETGLPALARWVRSTGPQVPVTAVVEIGDDVDEEFVEAELGRAEVEILYRTDGPGQLETAVRSLGGLEDGEFLVALGEAGELVPVRRYLRRELGLPAERLSLAGYWRRGTVNLDHHLPLDPSDPD